MHALYIFGRALFYADFVLYQSMQPYQLIYKALKNHAQTCSSYMWVQHFLVLNVKMLDNILFSILYVFR